MNPPVRARKPERSWLERVWGTPQNLAIVIAAFAGLFGAFKATTTANDQSRDRTAHWAVLGDVYAELDSVEDQLALRDSVLVRHGVEIAELQREVHTHPRPPRANRYGAYRPEYYGPAEPPREGTLLRSLSRLLPWNWGRRD